MQASDAALEAQRGAALAHMADGLRPVYDAKKLEQPVFAFYLQVRACA